MASIKQKSLFAFLALQLFGAAALILSFYIEAWAFELLVSFTRLLLTVLVISLVVSTVLVALTARFKRNIPLLAVTGLVWLAALFITFHSYSLQRPVEITDVKTETITFATLNKLYSNYDFERFTHYLEQQDIDILTLQEMRPAEVSDVAKRLGFSFTHTSRTFATSGGTSVVLLSRFPFASVETIELATEHPVIRAEIETPKNGNIVVYSVHIPVPASKYLYTKRNIVLDSLAETIQQENLPVIIGGDFNTTIFSPAMSSFSSAVGSQVKPVSPDMPPPCSWYGYGSIMCVRIDHLFAPRDAEITNFTISPDIGPDHRAIIAEIAL